MPLTAPAFDALVEQGRFEGDPNFYELVEGALVKAPPPSGDHEFITGRVLEAFADAVRAAGLRGGVELNPNGALSIDDSTVLSPDFRLGPRRSAPRRFSPPERVVVIEIAWSSRTYDTQDKARPYAKAGFADYWVVDIPAKTVLVHRAPVDGLYTSVHAVEAEGALAPLAAPGPVIQVGDLF